MIEGVLRTSANRRNSVIRAATSSRRAAIIGRIRARTSLQAPSSQTTSSSRISSNGNPTRLAARMKLSRCTASSP